MSNESKKQHISQDSMEPTISNIGNESAKSATPNTTKPVHTKPDFTPPAQNTSKSKEK